MQRQWRRLIIGAVITAVVIMLSPASAQADDYPTARNTGVSPGISVSCNPNFDSSPGGGGELNCSTKNAYVKADRSVQSGTVAFGGTVTSDPDIIDHGGVFGARRVFARGIDGGIWTQSYNTIAGLSGWTSLGGFTTSGPGAAVSWDGTTSIVFARGGDNALYYRTTTNYVTWTDWASLGGFLTSDPDASANNWAKGVTVTARGGDGQLCIRSWNGLYWSEWECLGGFSVSGPSIAYDGRSLHIIAKGPTGNAYVKDNVAGFVWGNWTNLGGFIVGDPDILAQDWDATGWDTPTGHPSRDPAAPPPTGAALNWHKQAWTRAPDNNFWANTWGTVVGGEFWQGWLQQFSPVAP